MIWLSLFEKHRQNEIDVGYSNTGRSNLFAEIRKAPMVEMGACEVL